MVRHNGTVANLTCHNIGVIIKRHRQTQSMIVSEFLEYTDAPILRATALTVYAYDDSTERYDAQEAEGKKHWGDPFRRQTMEAVVAAAAEEAARKLQQAAAEAESARDGDDEDDDNEDDDNEDGDDEDSDDEDSDDEDSDDEDSDEDSDRGNDNQGASNSKHGGGGQGGGSGTGGAGSGAGGSGRSGRGGGGGNGSSGREQQDKNGARRVTRQSKNDLNLNLSDIHLAFKAPKHYLWSKGFTELRRLNPLTAAALQETDLTPLAENPSLRIVEATFGLNPSEQQRRVSAGSARSRGSITSARTNAPSLFSDQAFSSAPTSPSTTTSFPDARSRDGSPMPEKSAGYQTGFSGAASATVCNAGILLHDILGHSARGVVWAGKMIPEDASDEDTSIPIAVKMAVPRRDNADSEATDNHMEIIRQEGLVYDRLTKSGKQETIAPRCYGVFEDGAGTVALVLDNGGTALQTFDDLTRDQQQALFAAALEMHSAGVCHNDTCRAQYRPGCRRKPQDHRLPWRGCGSYMPWQGEVRRVAGIQ
ncbi:hypothetical protein C8R47DRAFT_634249 [Mycena vitilis]|nr:hypothetical protein C8R47DRAFT_634249 [Mycena vitilis]